MADQKLHTMHPLKRWWISLHIKACVCCGKYQRDASKFQEAESKFADVDDNSGHKLDECFKEKLKEEVRQCCNDHLKK
ncbi:hypothetical protein PQO03_07115 [Lentisphaera profundi]|uniref:Uncharacterized protein n=1 Tax=Lentisphaera profundi TaxID=1658616 RepID=A0ABY7VRJ3_9BACT|nr:hypothetical protein [Lentisphaera profundi]WDE95486.1 hypothetical protein PQO03_07115 [Lentisphaera profundi]